jgi:5-formyltetrahydrofolate cyclo-ligase
MKNNLKDKQRKLLRGRRDDLTAEEITAFSGQIIQQLTSVDEFKQARSLFCYVSTGSEVQSHGLMKDLLASNRQVSVPRIADGLCMDAVLMTMWSELTPAEMGILTVKSGKVVTGPIDLVVTPGLGFSLAGQRIGYGKGYYDRWFSENEHVCRVGLCFDCQILSDLAYDDSDKPMDIIITPSRIIHIQQ